MHSLFLLSREVSFFQEVTCWYRGQHVVLLEWKKSFCFVGIQSSYTEKLRQHPKENRDQYVADMESEGGRNHPLFLSSFYRMLYWPFFASFVTKFWKFLPNCRIFDQQCGEWRRISSQKEKLPFSCSFFVLRNNPFLVLFVRPCPLMQFFYFVHTYLRSSGELQEW